MIPADLTARLRMLTEASFFEADQPVQALNRVTPIPADLPEFTPGQRLTATLQQALPDGLFRALVAGKSLTLALNSGDSPSPRPGQTLALEVTRNTPQALHAQVVAPQVAAEPAPALSQIGRLIGVLLTGQPAAGPAPLAAGRPLLTAPPAGGAALVPLLRDALSQSGLFYESHQVQWLAGRLPTAALLREPQGQIMTTASQPALQSTPQVALPGVIPQASQPELTPQPFAPAYTPEAAPAPERVSPEAAALGDEASGTRITGSPPYGAELEKGASPASLASGAERAEGAPPAEGHRGTAASAIPERLMPLVGQQLDALATHQFAWQGQVWPGQTMEWEIEDPTGGSAGGAAEDHTWNTSLRLTMPRLGAVEARLQLSAGGVSVRLLAAEPEARAALAAGREALAGALAGARLPLLGLSVEPVDERR